ncbi:MAG: GTP 3',8-cyclase MoaA, partial [Anaerotruncus rubiinfantis]
MRDNCGREIDYLRVSVTDRCNLRCVYCMPEEGVEPVSHREILSFEEILRVCRAAAKLGVRRIRLTGGEPLVRRGIVDLVRRVKEIDGIEQVSVTTNGLLFCDMAQDLAAAGLGGVNVSLDTLDPAVFCRITRRDSFGKALEAVRTALELGLLVKVNCVAAEEFGMQHPLSVAGLAKDHPVDVRFIEMMPIGLGNGFTPIPGGRIRTALERLYGPMTACAG